MAFVWLLIGLVLIIKGADVLIDSAAKLAGRFGVSTFIIGITVVAFGTSAPELVVGLVSGLAGANALTLGNAVGSSLANMAFITGVAALILPLAVRDSVVRREIPLLLGVQLVLCALLFFDGTLSHWDGAILLVGFAGFLTYVVRGTRQSLPAHVDAQGDLDTDNDGNGLPPAPPQPMGKLLVLTVLSLVALGLGGKLTVDSSIEIAALFGMSETLIGLTVLSLATTMPELITAVTAARKGEPEIVLGNAIGSSLFNILFVLGASAALHPIAAEPGLAVDAAAMVATTAVVFAFSAAHRRIRRLSGVLLVVGYIAYLTWKVLAVVL